MTKGTNAVCDEIRELFPGQLHGSLDPAEEERLTAHLSVCPACREEAGLLRAIHAGRPQPPGELEARIQSRLREELGSVGLRGAASEGTRIRQRFRLLPSTPAWVPSWALSAAAVLLLSLAVGVIWKPWSTGEDQDLLQVAAQDPLPEAWLWDDGMVAGAPVFDELSEDELRALLEEFGG